MPESLLDPSPPQEAESSPPASSQPTNGDAAKPEMGWVNNLFNSDLSMKEGWQDAFSQQIGEHEKVSFEVKNNNTLKNVKTLPDLLSTFVNQEKAIGRDKAIIPTADSPPGVWDDYFKKVGKPEGPDLYEFTVSDSSKIDPDSLSSFREHAHKNNFTQKQFAASLEFEEQRLAKLENDFKAQDESTKLATYNKLKSDWGEAYDGKIRKINDFFQKIGISKIVNDSGLGINYEWLSKVDAQIIKNISEDSSLLGPSEPFTPVDIDKQIREIITSPEYQAGKAGPEVQKRYDELVILRRKQKGK